MPFDFSAGSGGAGALLGIPVTIGDQITFEAAQGRSSPYGDVVGVEFVITAGPAASCTFRNGSGLNPSGFACVSRPVLGANWASSIVLQSTTVATFLGMSASAVQIPLLGGELLIGPAPAIVLSGLGTYSPPIPNSAALLGAPVATQGFRVDNPDGVPTPVILNAQDLILGY